MIRKTPLRDESDLEERGHEAEVRRAMREERAIQPESKIIALASQLTATH